MAERIRITSELDELFPGKVFKVGTQHIDIKPLGIAKLASISKKLKSFGEQLGKEGVTWDNYNDKGNILKIAITLLDQFPEVMEEASNIAKEDIQLLPIDLIVELLNTIIEVNLASKEKLEKNFNSLAEKFQIKKEKSQKK